MTKLGIGFILKQDIKKKKKQQNVVKPKKKSKTKQCIMGIATRATVEQRDSFPSAVRVRVLMRGAHAPPLAQWTFGLDHSWLQDCSMCCRVLSHIPCPHPQDGMLVAAQHKL